MRSQSTRSGVPASIEPPVMCTPQDTPEIFLDLLVQVDRVLLQLGDVRVAVDRVHAAGGVPGGARREFRAFDQQDVLPAGLGEVIQHARADDAATDHRHLHMIPHA